MVDFGEPNYENIEALITLRNFGDESECVIEEMHHIYLSEICEISCYNDDRVVLWLADNTCGKWSTDCIGDYYFENEEDAFACKLRWT